MDKFQASPGSRNSEKYLYVKSTQEKKSLHDSFELIWFAFLKIKKFFLKKEFSFRAHIVCSPDHWNSLGEGWDLPGICNTIYLSWIMSTRAIVSGLRDWWNLVDYELAWRLHGFWDLWWPFLFTANTMKATISTYWMCETFKIWGCGGFFWGDLLLFWWKGRTLQNIAVVETFTIQLWIYLSICI